MLELESQVQMEEMCFLLLLATKLISLLGVALVFQFQFSTFVTFTFFKEVKKPERHNMRNTIVDI